MAGQGVDTATWNDAVGVLLVMMAPMAPHISEELWGITGQEYSVHNRPWPEWDAELAADELVTLVVQVNGRLRDKIEVSASITEDEAKRMALESDRARPHIEGKDVTRVIYVPGKLVNIVAS